MDFETWTRIKPFVRRWQNMMDRCYNPECSTFKNYGGRGIKVCDDWHDPYTYTRQLPGGYFDGAHLDRINNNGDYTPDNVRWVTAKQNHQNRRSSVMIEFNGKTQNISTWAEEIGINAGTLHTRLQIKGWSVERALTEDIMGPHERMKIARDTRLARMKQERGIPADEPYITKKSMIPRRIERRVEYEGAMHTMKQLGQRTGIPEKKLRKRILERGWDVERAVAAG
jgi:hypothetical protein